MWFFGKKKKAAEQNQNDRNLIEINSKSIETLLVLSTDGEFNTELKKLEEKLKYLTASTDEKVYSYDKKIKGAIEDLKIALTKDGDASQNAKAKSLLKDIQVLVAERNSIV